MSSEPKTPHLDLARDTGSTPQPKVVLVTSLDLCFRRKWSTPGMDSVFKARVGKRFIVNLDSPLLSAAPTAHCCHTFCTHVQLQKRSGSCPHINGGNAFKQQLETFRLGKGAFLSNSWNLVPSDQKKGSLLPYKWLLSLGQVL